MNLKAIVGNALHGASSALGNVTKTHQPPATNTQANTSSANTGTPTDKQVREIIEHISTQQAKPSVFEEHVKEIDPKIVARRHIYDQPVIVELPKPAERMTKPDYDQAFARAVLKKAGMSDARDAEVAKFRNEYRRVSGGKFELTWNEQQLRAYQQQHGNRLPAHTSEYGLAVADAGMRQIHADRQEYAARVEQRRKEAQAYGTAAVTGFYEVQMNAPINLINDATKVVGLPELPKFAVGGEYWADKKQVAEAATTAGAAVLTGGAGLAGDLLIIGSSAGNIAEATTGTDMRTGEQLSTTDRVLRGASGAAGAYAVRGRVDEITEGVTSQVKNMKPPSTAAEAVTAEGVRVPSAADDPLAATQMEARAAKDVSGRRNLEAHEAVGGHTVKMHVNKSENWLRQRLAGDPDLPAASSFRNEEAANRVQGRFVKQYRAEIEAWVKHGSGWDFTRQVAMSDPVGIVLVRGVSKAVETNKASLTVVRDNSERGWHVLTAYPVK